MGLITDILYTNKTSKLAIKAMDIQAQKALLITGNIANAETPGFKAVELKPFEAELKEAFRPTVRVTKTHDKHLDGGSSLDSFEPEIVVSKEPGRLDGNNVNLDKVMTDMTLNEMMYRATIGVLKKRGQIINQALEPIR